MGVYQLHIKLIALIPKYDLFLLNSKPTLLKFQKTQSVTYFVVSIAWWDYFCIMKLELFI